MVLEAAELVYANKTKESITSQSWAQLPFGKLFILLSMVSLPYFFFLIELT